MPFFLHQVGYTSEAIARLIANPQDRFEAVRGPIEKLGGKIKDSHLAFGEHDAIVITETGQYIRGGHCLGVCGWRRLAELPDHPADGRSRSARRHAQGCFARIQASPRKPAPPPRAHN